MVNISKILLNVTVVRYLYLQAAAGGPTGTHETPRNKADIPQLGTVQVSFRLYAILANKRELHALKFLCFK